MSTPFEDLGADGGLVAPVVEAEAELIEAARQVLSADTEAVVAYQKEEIPAAGYLT